MNVRPTKTELWQERVFMLTLLADTAILVVFFGSSTSQMELRRFWIGAAIR
jgi:hypothetical protein